jgi:uncharacterized membrane protein
VRLGFQQKPYDLVAIFLTSAILASLASFGVIGFLRIALGLMFVLFAPGYVLTVTLFPRKVDLDWIERIALGSGLSVSIVAIISLGLNFTPWGIFLEPVLVALLLFTYGVGMVAYWRRIRLPLHERLSLSIDIRAPSWPSSHSDKIATVALAASLSIAAGTVVYILVMIHPGEHLTEFYMLNETGVAGGYPTNLTVNQTGVVKLTVHNAEYARTSYTIVVVQSTMEAFFNASAKQTQYRVISETRVTNITIELGNGGYWTRSYVFGFSYPGIFRLTFDLYKLPDTGVLYRYLFLTVFVKP